MFSRLLHFAFENPLWGGAPQLIKMLMSWDHMGWNPELNRSEENQTLCVLWQTVTIGDTPARAVCTLENLSWGFSKTPTMCWRALVLGLHTRGSSLMCWRMEGWKSALWCASSTCLTCITSSFFPQGRERWPHLATMATSTRDNPALILISGVWCGDAPSALLQYLAGAGSTV